MWAYLNPATVQIQLKSEGKVAAYKELETTRSFHTGFDTTPQISNIKKRFMDITIEGSIPKKRKVDE